MNFRQRAIIEVIGVVVAVIGLITVLVQQWSIGPQPGPYPNPSPAQWTQWVDPPAGFDGNGVPCGQYSSDAACWPQ